MKRPTLAQSDVLKSLYRFMYLIIVLHFQSVLLRHNFRISWHRRKNRDENLILFASQNIFTTFLKLQAKHFSLSSLSRCVPSPTQCFKIRKLTI